VDRAANGVHAARGEPILRRADEKPGRRRIVYALKRAEKAMRAL
jgi:hypothetical protein